MRLSTAWQDSQEIAVYGFGRVAQRNDKLIRDFSVKCIVDNDPRYAAAGEYRGMGIYNNLQKAIEGDILGFSK